MPAMRAHTRRYVVTLIYADAGGVKSCYLRDAIDEAIASACRYDKVLMLTMPWRRRRLQPLYKMPRKRVFAPYC